MKRWFVSDHHLWHRNIIQYANRPFENEWKMNEALLEYHNQVVKPTDHVYFLGDVTMRRGGRLEKEAFCREVRKYHGHKRLFLGNHDHWPTQVYLDAGFDKIRATWRDQQNIIYSHFPLHPGSLGGVLANVHGHIHANPSPKPVIGLDKHDKVIVKPYINVSVEAINYRPIDFDELMAKIEQAIKEAS